MSAQYYLAVFGIAYCAGTAWASGSHRNNEIQRAWLTRMHIWAVAALVLSAIK